MYPAHHGLCEVYKDYIFGETAGKGSFGKVQLVTNKKTGARRACKSIGKKNTLRTSLSLFFLFLCLGEVLCVYCASSARRIEERERERDSSCPLRWIRWEAELPLIFRDLSVFTNRRSSFSLCHEKTSLDVHASTPMCLFFSCLCKPKESRSACSSLFVQSSRSISVRHEDFFFFFCSELGRREDNWLASWLYIDLYMYSSTHLCMLFSPVEIPRHTCSCREREVDMSLCLPTYRSRLWG